MGATGTALPRMEYEAASVVVHRNQSDSVLQIGMSLKLLSVLRP